jgi:hypothetical protein
LLPTALKLLSAPATAKLFRLPSDKYLLGYLALLMTIQIPVTTGTDSLRAAVLLFIDVFLPYYVFSRGLADPAKLRDTLASFAAGCGILAVLSLFEVGKGWLLYSSLPNFLNVTWNFGGYMVRDGGLRAAVSTGHPIVYGYVATVALGLQMALRPYFPTDATWRNMLILLGLGVVASGSRGPWVGAVALLLMISILSPGRGVRLAKISAGAVVVIPCLLFSPLGPKIIALLPFVGNYDAGSVDYRQQLFEASWSVFKLNPFLGSPYYMSNPIMESMRQGEHIIDMVNSYLGIALVSGAIGLSLFLGAFVSSAMRIARRLFADKSASSDGSVVGRALLVTLVGVFVIIATASSINAIPVVYWCLAGACAAVASWPAQAFMRQQQAVEPQVISPVAYQTRGTRSRARRAEPAA